MYDSFQLFAHLRFIDLMIHKRNIMNECGVGICVLVEERYTNIVGNCGSAVFVIMVVALQ